MLPGANLENSIALSLTIVFVLPTLAPRGSDEFNGSKNARKGLSINDKFILYVGGGGRGGAGRIWLGLI